MKKDIKIGLSVEAQVNREFIDAWHKAERDEIKILKNSYFFYILQHFSGFI